MALAQIEIRSGTAANWTSENPVLAAGEPGFETDTGLMKVGDGVTNWNDLTYNTSIRYGSSLPATSSANEGDIFLVTQ